MKIPANIQSFIEKQADEAPAKYDDLRAVIFNGTLKRSPEPSHTEALLSIPQTIMGRVGVKVDLVRTVDHVIPPGVWPDMTEHGYEQDDFPKIYRELVEPADILMIAGPIWLGDQASPTRLIIERLYAYSGDVNDAGQWSYYGKVGGAVTTGNEDGGKHVSRPGPLCLAAHRRDRASPDRLLLERRGGSRRFLCRPDERRPRECLDKPQHHLYDVEHPSLRAHAQRCGRRPGLRQFHL